VRELENLMAEVVAKTRPGATIRRRHMEKLAEAQRLGRDPDVEMRLYMKVLEDLDWNKRDVAKKLGVPWSTFRDRYKRYGFEEYEERTRGSRNFQEPAPEGSA
jgi:transcriptional regulator of acetoin/glycerol metabolism